MNGDIDDDYWIEEENWTPEELETIGGDEENATPTPDESETPSNTNTGWGNN